MGSNESWISYGIDRPEITRQFQVYPCHGIAFQSRSCLTSLAQVVPSWIYSVTGREGERE